MVMLSVCERAWFVFFFVSVSERSTNWNRTLSSYLTSRT